MSGGPLFGKTTKHLSFVVVPVAFWAAVRFLQLKYLGWGTGYDVGLYQQYAQQWGSGAAAYVDFHPEYPPGALPIFLLPLLSGGATDYAHSFAIEMACFDLASAILVFLCVRLDTSASTLRAMGASALYTLITMALYPVLYSRFDLVPGTLVLGAVYCLHARHSRTSAALLGMAGAVKLWPFALVPLWLGWELHRRGLRRLVAAGFWIGVGAVLITLPILPRAGWQVLSFLQYHAARGIQIETTWSTAALLLGRLGIASVHPEHNFGAFHVGGRLPSILAVLSMPLTVAFALVPQAIALARGFGKEPNRVADYAALGSAIGFMIAGKVLSPQFMLWIAPILPLVFRSALGWPVPLAIGVLTTVVYPYLSPALEQRAPGHDWALLAVSTRNLLLIGCYWMTVGRVIEDWRPRWWRRAEPDGGRTHAPS